ncbi:hypothetical protein LEP1GSC038_1833 [Leptospira weilii str. 2006001855]|uniref:Uncharacterized protein n=1 Tax=Leptospira weilii str. 2006001855 TaxID=996804 RepID=M6FJP3_9LEPT|nr:hypothetical protein LEP1GSC038_1833 [Leptospira weilii str. 2006001855]
MFPVHTGWELSFTGDLSEFRRIYLRIQVLVGKVMVSYGLQIRRNL